MLPATSPPPSALATIINPALPLRRSDVTSLLAEGFDLASLGSFRMSRALAAPGTPSKRPEQPTEG